MAQYDGQPDDVDAAEKSRLEQEELMRQLQTKPAVEPTKAEIPADPAAIAAATGVADSVADNPATQSAPDYTKRGKYATFNPTAADKYDRPWDDLSERYKMQTVLSNFDPNAGITPEVIAALNAANIKGAKFSGSKDKLDARGLSAWENYDGREGIGDIIQGFNDPNNKNKSWGAWQPEDAGPSRSAGPMGAAGGGPSAIQGINSLMPTDTDFYGQLQSKLAEILGGPQALDREALLQQLGAR